jgi:hypothetical protein
MTVSEELEDDETRVFASAAPVEPTDLVDEPETPVKQSVVASREVGADGPTAPAATATKARPSAGRPTWHLSLTLGLVIALVGGVLLWIQSPELALLVGGALVILVGLALALWYLFGSGALSRRGTAARRDANRGGTPSANRAVGGNGRDGANRRGSANREDGTARRRRGDTNDRGDTRSRRPQHRDTDRGGTGANRRGNRDASADRGANGNRNGGAKPSQPGGKPSSPGAKAGPAGAKPNPPGAKPNAPSDGKPPGNDGRRPLVGDQKPSRPDGPTAAERRAQRRRAAGYPRSEVITCGGRPTPSPTVRKLKAADKAVDAGKKRVKLKPLKWRSRSGKLPVPRPPKATTVKPSPVKPATVAEPKVEWPNVDHDQVASQPMRIIIPRRAVRLPRRYHSHAGEPSWPTTDPDRPPPTPSIPDQRNRRGIVSEPDLLTRATREQHFNEAATVATSAAQDKDTQANQLLALAGELDGVEGMETVQEGHYRAAAAAAHDAEVRRGKASIYSFLSQNPT